MALISVRHARMSFFHFAATFAAQCVPVHTLALRVSIVKIAIPMRLTLILSRIKYSRITTAQ